ncbi:MAG: FISUMP domain-containing protein [Butyricimonas paravirosa]
MPTDDDWLKLEKVLGMSISDLERSGNEGSVQGNCCNRIEGTGINLQLSGYLIPDNRVMEVYSFVSVYGFYWTATIDESKREVIRFIIDRLFIILQSCTE